MAIWEEGEMSEDLRVWQSGMRGMASVKTGPRESSKL